MRRRMGYVIQDAGLFPHWTVAPNVGAGAEARNWEPARAAARVESCWGRGVAGGGVRPALSAPTFRRPAQRVGIARALGADPPLLLLDEPFAALDPITRCELQRQFLALRRTVRKTALFVTHDVREAMLVARASRCCARARSTLVATPAEFRAAATRRSARVSGRNEAGMNSRLATEIVQLSLRARGAGGDHYRHRRRHRPCRSRRCGAAPGGAPLGVGLHQYRADRPQPGAVRLSAAVRRASASTPPSWR